MKVGIKLKTNLVYFDETGDDGLIKTSSETFILTSIYMSAENWQKKLQPNEIFKKRIKNKIWILCKRRNAYKTFFNR